MCGYLQMFNKKVPLKNDEMEMKHLQDTEMMKLQIKKLAHGVNDAFQEIYMLTDENAYLKRKLQALYREEVELDHEWCLVVVMRYLGLLGPQKVKLM